MPGPIAYLARSAVLTRLADNTLGYEAALAAIFTANTYPNISVDDRPILQIPDFTATGAQVVLGDLPPDMGDRTSTLKYPLLTLDTEIESNQDSTVGATFAGIVNIKLKLYLSWSINEALYDFASFGDCATQALYTSLNDPAHSYYGAGLIYAGKLVIQRSPIVPGGQNWRQLLNGVMPFRVQVC